MQEILSYLRSLSPVAREAFAQRCQTSVGYLRKAVSTNQRLGVELCVRLERESGGVLRCEVLYPSLDWAYLRSIALRGDLENRESLGKNQPHVQAVHAQGAIGFEARQQAQGVAHA